MMVMGRSISDGVQIAMLCFPKEETGDRLKFVLVEGFRYENDQPVWDEEQVFYELNQALRAWFNYERVGLRSLATGMAT